MTPEQQQKSIAVALGYVSGLHRLALTLDQDGVEGMDQVACAMEDVSGMLSEALTSDPGPQALARNL